VLLFGTTRALERRHCSQMVRRWRDITTVGRRVRILVQHRAERCAVTLVSSAVKAWRTAAASCHACRSSALVGVVAISHAERRANF